MKFKHSLKKINYCLIFCFFISCSSNKNKGKYTSAILVCDKNLYVETFTIIGNGAYGGDRVSNYLTDSTNFRMYVGSFDNAHENYTYQCSGDSVYIEKQVVDEEGMPYNTKSNIKVVDKKTVDLKTLKEENKFE